MHQMVGVGENSSTNSCPFFRSSKIYAHMQYFEKNIYKYAYILILHYIWANAGNNLPLRSTNFPLRGVFKSRTKAHSGSIKSVYVCLKLGEGRKEKCVSTDWTYSQESQSDDSLLRVPISKSWLVGSRLQNVFSIKLNQFRRTEHF